PTLLPLLVPPTTLHPPTPQAVAISIFTSRQLYHNHHQALLREPIELPFSLTHNPRYTSRHTNNHTAEPFRRLPPTTHHDHPRRRLVHGGAANVRDQLIRRQGRRRRRAAARRAEAAQPAARELGLPELELSRVLRRRQHGQRRRLRQRDQRVFCRHPHGPRRDVQRDRRRR
ncbi:hypothetical protein BZA05DRAFT_472057, partial [Tricharina praecox]|uniref:uncharacterized protein n=1 Tax=Tricharina praecox TaxID=43433 RepID=UPI00221FDA2D